MTGTETLQPATDATPVQSLDLLWGADEIADALGCNRRQAYWLLQRNLIPAVKVGSKWIAQRQALHRHFLTALEGVEN